MKLKANHTLFPRLRFAPVVAIVLVLALFGCKRKGTCTLDTEMLTYVEFNVGSYWVYENKTTLNQDSLYLSSSSKVINEISGSDDYKEGEELYEQWYSSAIGGTFSAGAGCYPNHSYGRRDIGYFVEDVFQGSYFVENLSQLTVGAETFSNIKHFRTVTTPSTNSNHVFFARNVGVVRVIYDSGDTLDLINYHIQ